MKKFKYLLLALVALVVCACGASIEDVAEDVREEVKAHLEKKLGTSVSVGEVVLVHKGDNVYESVVSVSAYGETEEMSLKVVYDGDAYTWELY